MLWMPTGQIVLAVPPARRMVPVQHVGVVYRQLGRVIGYEVTLLV